MKTKQRSMQDLWKDSYLSENDTYLEELYETYLKTPDQISPEWQQYFKQISNDQQDISHADIRHYFTELVKRRPGNNGSEGVSSYYQRAQEKVIDLIAAYRNFGHLQANIDPLGLYKGREHPTLDLNYYGFTQTDYNTTFDVGSFLGLKKTAATLNEIYQTLRKIYCGTIGIEYRHIPQLAEVEWLQQRIEQQWPVFSPSKEEKLHILDRLIVADGLEKYIGFKYVGQKPMYFSKPS